MSLVMCDLLLYTAENIDLNVAIIACTAAKAFELCNLLSSFIA